MNNKQEVRKPRNQKSLWLVWFPYPSSWLRSFALVLWMAVVIWIVGFWSALFGIALANILKRPETLLWFLGLALLVDILVFSYIHNFLCGKPSKRWPRWLPSPKSLWEGLLASIVMSLAIMVGVLCVMPFHNFEYYSQAAIETESKWFGSIWLVTAAYLYQVEYLIQQRFASKVKTALNR